MMDLQEHFDKIEQKLGDVITRISEYQKVIQTLQKENIELRERLKELKTTQDTQQNEERLNIITQSILRKEDKTEIKKEINELVREIDYCISYINGK